MLEFKHVRTGSVYSVSQTLRYRVNAKNGVGYSSLWSEEVVLNPDNKPSGMTPVTLSSVLPDAITI